KDYDLGTFSYVQTLTDWPELRGDAFFHTKREAYILQYLAHCYQKALPVCRTQAHEAWNLSRRNLAHGTLLAEILATYDPGVELRPFITSALNDEAAKFYCRKEFIQSWLISKIG